MAHNIWVKERRNFKGLNIGIQKLFKLQILNSDPINNILLNMEFKGFKDLESFEIFNISSHLLKYALKCYNRNVTFQ
jgi:hypothetical protein